MDGMEGKVGMERMKRESYRELDQAAICKAFEKASSSFNPLTCTHQDTSPGVLTPNPY